MTAAMLTTMMVCFALTVSVAVSIGLASVLGIQIANANMVTAIRRVTTETGRDLRHADMIAYGGSGPVQAVGLARSLGHLCRGHRHGVLLGVGQHPGQGTRQNGLVLEIRAHHFTPFHGCSRSSSSTITACACT